MIKVKAIQEFTLKDFDKIKNIVRASNKNEKGRLYKDDTFECDKNMADYLTGTNDRKICVVEIIEVVPEEPVIEFIQPEIKGEIVKDYIEKKKTTRKRTSKK